MARIWRAPTRGSIEWFVDRTAPDSDPQVAFVVAQGEGFDIDLELQAGIVSATAAYADVRFIDDRAEAFGDGDTVRDGGLLLAVGPAVSSKGGAIMIDADRVREP